jgi:single-stranded-DNA-specific exonuclease
VTFAPLSFCGRNWLWPELHVAHPGGEGAGEPPFLHDLLLRRGVPPGPARQAFLTPSLGLMLDPGTMAHMDRAIDRLLYALDHGERVMIWGDYDVDGVCATSVLMAFFNAVGIGADFYIPDRRSEGYGLNQAAMVDIARSHKLLVTVDCGSTALSEIAHAKTLGLDTVVVDHHQVLPELPEAIACINPQRSDCAYPDKGLCAAGLAFMLAVALRRTLRERGHFHGGRAEPDLRPLLDMVAVATVADMVPLTGINRMLVHVGLERLRRAPRPGLKALCDVAQVAAAEVTAQDLGFRIGPRINARGRMEHAGLAVDLMLTDDPVAAQVMAEQLNAANNARRTLEKHTVEQAIAQVDERGLGQNPVLVVANPSWHAGVLGLVASRLVARYHRPAVVIGEDGKGSARSIAKINLHRCLQAAQDTMVRFGGHPAAAGLTILPDNIEALSDKLQQEVSALLGSPPYVPDVAADLSVDGHFLTPALYGHLHKLAPFGQHNPEPLLAARAQAVVERRLVGEDHLKLRLGERGYEAIAFGMGHLLPQLKSHVDVLFYLDRSVFRGTARLQMRVYDLRCAHEQACANGSASLL